MAPTSSDPKELKMLLNPARRRALTILVGSIVSQMRFGVEHSFQQPPAAGFSPGFAPRSPRDQSPAGSPGPRRDLQRQDSEPRLEKSVPRSKLLELEKAALKYFDDWQDEVITGLGKIVNAPEDSRSDQRRREWLAARNPSPPPYSPHPTSPQNPNAAAEAIDREIQEAKDVITLNKMYPPVPSRLTTISKEDRMYVVSCMVLLLLSLGHYSAHSRVLLCYLTSSLSLPLSALTNEETEIARTLLRASKALSADAETQKRKDENASSRRWKVGLASVAGAALIGVTGGIAAPIVAGAIGGLMGTVGLGGVASFLGIFAMNGALVGSLFGAFGGKMTGSMVDSYAKEVSDFKFLPIKEEWGEFGTREEEEIEGRRLRVTIGINGWLKSNQDVCKPWRVLGQDSEVFALRYEMDALLELGNSLDGMVASYAWSAVKLEILKRTVLATLWSALWPVYILKMATLIDNPFSKARRRSEKAGEVLADALINKAQGERPVTLVGYSLGSRVIYSCLRSLAERKAFGLVESVVLIGTPAPSTPDSWRVMRAAVSGKVFNVFSENDYILAFLYRATSIQLGVAGLQEIRGVEGVENINLSKEVSGHLRYPDLIGKILKRAGFDGIKVEDADIEEENHAEIQLLDADPGTNQVMETRSTQALIPNLMDDDPVAMNDWTPMPENNTSSVPALPPRSPILQTPAPEPEKSNNTTAPVSHLTSRMTTTTIRDDPDSDSDDGGIQMIDNDSDSGGELAEMTELPEPVPEEDPIQREEPKSLGRFPKGGRPAPADFGLF